MEADVAEPRTRTLVGHVDRRDIAETLGADACAAVGDDGHATARTRHEAEARSSEYAHQRIPDDDPSLHGRSLTAGDDLRRKGNRDPALA
ncbi:hypothetical protein ASF57_05410 [Methylobacterium sp. Leaf117]|nr:hypothetical protein ASF57_05410 [Methylobacterium sp. Leaf117]